jgi:hypothetical protein
MSRWPKAESVVFIDPSSDHFYQNKLFDGKDDKLNRDGCLLPYHRLAATLTEQGTQINTADLLVQRADETADGDYYSLGILDNFERLKNQGVSLKGFLLLEPPIVCPETYRALPELTATFDRVYVHNIVGDGYSLQGVDRSKLRQLFWPQPFRGVLEQHWGKGGRLNRIVVINGNHKPRSRAGELYSRRIEAMAALAKLDAVDLYGVGWDKWWSRRSMWLPYWLHRSMLLSIYRGSCVSKYETLSRYRFCLCFENMEMSGYVTEKLFDCLYAGTVPLYLGAPDISSLIPAETYIDCRKFASWEEMWREISSMSDSQINTIREAGRAYLNSKEFVRYYDSLLSVVDTPQNSHEMSD